VQGVGWGRFIAGLVGEGSWSVHKRHVLLVSNRYLRCTSYPLHHECLDTWSVFFAIDRNCVCVRVCHEETMCRRWVGGEICVVWIE
jgi:hypothetical protein